MFAHDSGGLKALQQRPHNLERMPAPGGQRSSFSGTPDSERPSASGHSMEDLRQRLSRSRGNANADSIISQLRAMNLGHDFWMYSFKVVPCTQAYSHKWTLCPCAHAGETARRRDPRTHSYRAVPCPLIKAKKTCPMGDSCPFSHNIFEHWLHPSRYKTRLCSFGRACSRPCCFFAHDTSELRYVDSSEDAKDSDERDYLMQVMMAHEASGSSGSAALGMSSAGLFGSDPSLGLRSGSMGSMQGPSQSLMGHQLQSAASSSDLGAAFGDSMRPSFEDMMAGMRTSLPGTGHNHDPLGLSAGRLSMPGNASFSHDQVGGMVAMRMSMPGGFHGGFMGHTSQRDQHMGSADLRAPVSGNGLSQDDRPPGLSRMRVSFSGAPFEQPAGGQHQHQHRGLQQQQQQQQQQQHGHFGGACPPLPTTSSVGAPVTASGLVQQQSEEVSRLDAASLLLGLQESLASLNLASDGGWPGAGVVGGLNGGRLSDPGTSQPVHLNPMRHLDRISDSGQTLGLTPPAIANAESLLSSMLAGTMSLPPQQPPAAGSAVAAGTAAPLQRSLPTTSPAQEANNPEHNSAGGDGSSSAPSPAPAPGPDTDAYVKDLVAQLQQQGLVTSKEQLVASLSQLLAQLLVSS